MSRPQNDLQCSRLPYLADMSYLELEGVTPIRAETEMHEQSTRKSIVAIQNNATEEHVLMLLCHLITR